jgi:uncharacterized YigZ family protein
LKTIKNLVQTSVREKGSEFIGYLFPIESKAAFEDKLRQIKSKYPDATHHCYGWRIEPHKINEFAQDDGEPSGTAGLPILNQLKSYDIVNCACIVVRYFGGTKLGKSGLIEAYGHTAKLGLEKASLLTLITTQNFKITYPYSEQTKIDQLKNNFDLKEINAQYLEKVTLQIACRSEQAAEFLSRIKLLEHLGIEVKQMGNGLVTLES